MHRSEQAYGHLQRAPSGWAVALAGMIALAAAVGIGRFSLTPILPMMQDDFGVGAEQGGWLASVNSVGYLLGALWAMVHRAKAQYAIRTALLVTAAATLAMGAFESMTAWLILRTIAGISCAWALIHVTSWCVGQLTPLRRPVLNGAVFAGVGAGIIVAGALCLLLMWMDARSQEAWVVLGVISFVFAGLAWPILGVGRSVSSANAASGRYRWTPDSLRLVLCYGAFGLGYIIPATFVPFMAKQIVSDPSVFGWAWPIFGIAAASSTLFAASLMRAMGNRRLWMLGASAMAIGVVSPLIIPGLSGIAIAAVLVGGTFMVTTMAGIQEAREVAGRHASALVAALTSAFAIGQILGPLLVSLLASRPEGFTAALGVAFALLLLSAIALNSPQAPSQMTTRRP